MPFHILRGLLFLSSILIMIVGASYFLLGPDIAYNLMLDLMKPLLGDQSPIVEMSNPNVDSEIRTLSPLLVAYGFMVFLCAKHLRTHLYYVPHLLLTFAFVGSGRILSYFLVGTPHPLFFVLAGLELGIPLVLYLLYRYAVSKMI